MGEIASLISLVGAAVVLAELARYANVPYPVFLVLGGLAIGFAPGLPTVVISPEVIFLVFLPPVARRRARHVTHKTGAQRNLRRRNHP